ncbi:WD_REPEATS_REGION domain-containing protein [Psidium guajava]|nr:WD_REPEATS_REGION domain-containing protein [Psidium guajava]
MEKKATFGRMACPAFHVACVFPFMPNNDARDLSTLSADAKDMPNPWKLLGYCDHSPQA